jgi:MOSC domain-containing protein YiiM
MDPVEEAELVPGRGVVGNADQGGKRQVTLIEQEVWDDLMRETGGNVSPSARRANLLVKGFPLAESRGRIARVGNCRIRIHGETRPCEQMDEALPGLRQAMKKPWAGGAFAEVLEGGRVRLGDEIVWELDSGQLRS